jgi:hypothetical protein
MSKVLCETINHSMPHMSRACLRGSDALPAQTGEAFLWSGRHGRIGKSKGVAAIVMILAVLAVTACSKNAPGRDGRYATHDRGMNNRP